MASIRQRRINERLHEELTMLLPGRIDDPVLTSVVVTRVQATQDLGTAKVFVTTSHDADPEEIEGIMEALSNARRFLRSELADVGLRRVPQLVFQHDTEFEEGARVLAMLDRMEGAKDEDPDEEASEADQPDPPEPDPADASSGADDVPPERD